MKNESVILCPDSPNANAERTGQRVSFFDARMKVLIRNVFGSAAARIINLFITLALVPLTINALSTTEYAYFAMAISLSVLAAYADLGMGLAVVNVVAERGAKPPSDRAQRAVSVVWFSLLGIAIVGLLLTLLLAVGVNYGLQLDSIQQYNAMLLAVGSVFAGLPTGLVQRVLFAEQKNIQANAWATCGRLISLGVVWTLVATQHANLLLLVFAVIGVPVLIGWLSVFSVFGKVHIEDLRPKWCRCDFRLFLPYLMLGLSFLVMQLVPYVETGIDTLLIGNVIDINLVPAFDVYSKLFTYVPALISIGIFPLWPAIANAKASGDIVWILRIRRLSYFVVAGITLLIGAIFLFFSGTIILLWTGKSLMLPTEAVLAMSVFSMLTCIGTVQSMILSGLGVIKDQVKIYLIYLVVMLIGKSIAASISGLVAMLWSLNGIYLFRLFYAERLFKIRALAGKKVLYGK